MGTTDDKNVSDITEKIEFAKNTFCELGAGGTVKSIRCTKSNQGYGLFVSWHVGISKGNGVALFEGDGSALLAVEKLKNVTFGNRKLRIADPVKYEGREGI